MENHPQHMQEHNYFNTKKEKDILQPPIVTEEGEVNVIQPRTYRAINGIKNYSLIYVDNVGYTYNKCDVLAKTISLACQKQKNPRCFAKASISKYTMDNMLTLRKPHNHCPNKFNLNVLLSEISDGRLDHRNTEESARNIYNSEII